MLVLQEMRTHCFRLVQLTQKAVLGKCPVFKKESLEIAGLPKSLTNDEVETKVCQVFRSQDCNVNEEDLGACQWLKDKEQVTVKFYRKKHCEEVLNAKNNLQKLDTINLDLPEGSKFLLTKIDASTIVCFGQLVKNYKGNAESLVGTFQTGQLS